MVSAQRIRLEEANVPSGDPVILEAPPGVSQYPATLMPPGEPDGSDCFANPPVLFARCVGGSAVAALDDWSFDAPVNGIVNFPNFLDPWLIPTQERLQR